MESDHYFSAEPASDASLRPLHVELAGQPRQLVTAGGIFSPDRVDLGTTVLLANTPPPPPGGNLLDLGSGWGPISLSLALEAPRATVWAVDVNRRALDLVRRNAERLGLENVRAVLPDEVPGDVRFMTIRSNPPIRVGKNELHAMLLHWLPRLEHDAEAWMVVARHLGSDSLQRWLGDSLPEGFHTFRAATNKGFRVLRVRHR